MNSTLKKILPLVVVLLALSGLAAWDEWKTKQEEKQKTEENHLYKFDVAAVERFDYFSENESTDEKTKEKKTSVTTASFKRQDAKWLITSPVEASADASTVEGVLKAVSDYKYEKAIGETKADWAKFSLDKPKRKLSIYLKGQPTPVDVYVGNNTPVGYSVYVGATNSEKVFIGGQFISTSTGKSLSDFRDKSFVNIVANDVTKLVYTQGKDKPVEFAKKDGKFAVEKPEIVETDSSTVTSFIEDINALKASDFVDKTDKAQQDAFSDKKVAVTISWTDAKAATQTLKFAEFNKELFAAYDPKVRLIKISSDSKSRITKTLNDFRNKKVFAFQSSKVETVDIDGTTFKKDADNWYAGDDKTKPKIHVRTLLVDLEYGKAEEFLKLDSPIAKSLTQAPKHKLKLTFTADTSMPPLTIDVWADPKDASKVYVKHSSGKFIYKTGASLFNGTSEAPAAAPNAKSDGEPPLGLPDMNGPG